MESITTGDLFFPRGLMEVLPCHKGNHGSQKVIVIVSTMTKVNSGKGYGVIPCLLPFA